MVSSAKGDAFGGFTCGVASFRVAGVALRDIQTCFVTCRKLFCVAGAILLHTFATFSEDALQFSRQAQHFGRVHLHFAWQAQHFRRVMLRVFCESHCQGCVKWRQGANSVAGVAFCEMWWQLTEAPHETLILRLQIFRFGGKLVGKHRFWSYKVSKLKDVSHEMLFDAPTCLESLVSLWHRRVYGGSCKTSPFRRFPSRLSCRFAWQARHFVTSTCWKSFCVASAILLRRFRKMICSFRGAAFWRSLSSFCVAGAALHTPHSTLHTPHSTLHPLHSTLHTLHFTLYTLHCTLHTPHFTLYIHSTLYTLHFTPHSTLHIPHFTLYTPHSTLHTLHSRLYTPHSTLSKPPSSIFHLARRLLPYSIFHATTFHCSNKLFHESVLRDCISMCFDICAINIRVSIRVCGLHLVFCKRFRALHCSVVIPA